VAADEIRRVVADPTGDAILVEDVSTWKRNEVRSRGEVTQADRTDAFGNTIRVLNRRDGVRTRRERIGWQDLLWGEFQVVGEHEVLDPMKNPFGLIAELVQVADAAAQPPTKLGRCRHHLKELPRIVKIRCASK
jgi:hypothetical protein